MGATPLITTNNPQNTRSTKPDQANTARHYANEQRAATHQHGEHCTLYGARHPLWAAAPVMGRDTRSEGVHCLQIGCSAPNHKNKRGICETTADTHKAG